MTHFPPSPSSPAAATACGNRKAIWGWVLYDWANSAFATTVMAGFFPLFFKQYWSHGTDANVSTAQLGLGNSIASLIVALLAPVLGAIADRASLRKKLLIFFAYLGVTMTAGLFLVGKGQWELALLLYVTAIVGFSGSVVFYDSLLPAVAPESDIDRISSRGYAMGYLGGGLLFLVNVLMTLMPERFGLPDAAVAVRCAFLSVALWWGGFTVFTILWVPESAVRPVTPAHHSLVFGGLRQFGTTLRGFRRSKTLWLFLAAYWFYIDGVDTIIRMAVDYGLALGFQATDLIGALLVVQFVGFPAALGFGRLSQAVGARRAIFLAIGSYFLITLWSTQVTVKAEFYILAVMIGLVQGGIQALSRSYFTRLIPANRTAEYFGFYNMLGKFAAILGPALMGLVGLVAKRLLLPPVPSAADLLHYGQVASRWSIGSIAVLFLIGGVLFYFVDEKKGRAEASRLSGPDPAPPTFT
ncbi:MAG: MFS transporter [Desulfobacterales bacterium]